MWRTLGTAVLTAVLTATPAVSQNRPALSLRLSLDDLVPPQSTPKREVTLALLWRHRILYCLLGAVAVGVLFSLGCRLTESALEGSAAAGLLALQPTFVYSSSLPLKTTVDIVLLASGLLLTLRARDASCAAAAVLRASLAAALFLAAALNQWAILGPWLVVIASVAARHRPRPGGRAAPLVPLVVALLLLPLVRSALGELSAPSGARWCWPQWGIHMLIGAQPAATGVYQPVPGIQSSPRGHTLEARLAAEALLGRPTTPDEADAFFRAQTRAAAAADPSRALRLLWRKTRLFFNAFEPKENFFVDELRQRSAVLRRLPETWGWLVALAAAGGAARRGDSVGRGTARGDPTRTRPLARLAGSRTGPRETAGATRRGCVDHDCHRVSDPAGFV